MKQTRTAEKKKTLAGEPSGRGLFPKVTSASLIRCIHRRISSQVGNAECVTQSHAGPLELIAR
jgi:hypothetical protein